MKLRMDVKAAGEYFTGIRVEGTEKDILEAEQTLKDLVGKSTSSEDNIYFAMPLDNGQELIMSKKIIASSLFFLKKWA